MQVLQDLETAHKVFSSLGFVVKQDKSFLFLTQFTGFPGACLQTISAKAYLPQEHFSCSGKTGQAITGRSCHRVEDTSGSSEPYGTLHVPLHVRLCMHPSARLTLGTDPPNRAVAASSCCCPSGFGWTISCTAASAKGYGCVYLFTLKGNY